MSGRRSGRAVVQLLYFVARAWLALTTPVGAQTEGTHAWAGVAVERKPTATQAVGLDPAIIFSADVDPSNLGASR